MTNIVLQMMLPNSAKV